MGDRQGAKSLASGRTAMRLRFVVGFQALQLGMLVAFAHAQAAQPLPELPPPPPAAEHRARGRCRRCARRERRSAACRPAGRASCASAACASRPAIRRARPASSARRRANASTPMLSAAARLARLARRCIRRRRRRCCSGRRRRLRRRAATNTTASCCAAGSASASPRPTSRLRTRTATSSTRPSPASPLALNVDVGFSPVTNFVLQARFGLLITPTRASRSKDRTTRSAATSRIGTLLLAPGITYYFMPINIYLTAAVGLAWFTFDADRTYYYGTTDDYDDSSDATNAGVGLNFDVGKEWWVGRQWGIGVAGRLSYAAASGEVVSGRYDYSQWGFTVLFSATPAVSAHAQRDSRTGQLVPARGRATGPTRALRRRARAAGSGAAARDRDLRLQPRQVRAEAEMDAAAEGQMRALSCARCRSGRAPGTRADRGARPRATASARCSSGSHSPRSPRLRAGRGASPGSARRSAGTPPPRARSARAARAAWRALRGASSSWRTPLPIRPIVVSKPATSSPTDCTTTSSGVSWSPSSSALDQHADHVGCRACCGAPRSASACTGRGPARRRAARGRIESLMTCGCEQVRDVRGPVGERRRGPRAARPASRR